MAIHPNQINAMKEVLEGFKTQSYAVLLAPMQSGKTTTFRLIACEMLRQQIVERVVIFSGTSDTDLRDQTQGAKGHADAVDEFKASYRAYIDETDLDEDGDFLDMVEVVWAQKLDDYEPGGSTLYIWEESHYGQSQAQRVSRFLAKVQIDATGSAPDGCYVLSVSATPFSELSDDHHLNQSKHITILKPGDGYTGVKQLKEKGRIHSFTMKELPRIVSKYKGYVVIRASLEMEKQIVAHLAGFQIIRFDMTDKRNLNDILKIAPTRKTVVLIKGKLRMGKVLYKEHIQCVIETSKQCKTDTVLQGLLGRCCGYTPGNIDIYVHNLKWPEIDRFIEMFDGNLTSLPEKAMNMDKKHRQLEPCIPIKIKRSEQRASTRDKKHLWNDIFPGITATTKVSDLTFHEDDADRFWNGNSREHVKIMRNRIKELSVFSAKGPNESHMFLVHGTRIKPEKQDIWAHTIACVKTAFEARVPKSSFGDTNAGCDGQMVVWYTDMDLYITIQVPKKIEASVPVTTGREVFCHKSGHMNGGFGLNVPEKTRTCAKELEHALERFIDLSLHHVSSRKITNNGVYKCIHLTPTVYKELSAMKTRQEKKGIDLNWKMAPGRRPTGTDIRLSEITWSFTVETAIAYPFPIDLDDLPIGTLIP